MQAIQIISQDLFDKVRSRFENLEMGDSTGAVTIDPKEARFFDFDFVLEGVDLGRVSVSLGELGSLKVFYSQGITENKDNFAKKIWYSFLKEMRLFAMRRLLRFDTRDIAKTNLEQKDFQYLASKSPKEEPMSTMNESRWNQKSTKKTSRAVKGKTEVIVRHKNAVAEEYPGSRSFHKNIKAIFIQNADGERFKYPFIHPAGAFAMAQHVDHGGVPHDPAGKAIIEMSEQIAQLQEFSRHIRRATLHDDAMSISERAMGKLNELKAHVAALSKRQHYENWMAEFNEGSDDLMTELDAVTMEDYKSKFTQTNFQEELSKFFPLLHRIMGEANAVNLDEFVKEDEDDQDTDQDQSSNNVDPSDQFTNWADSVESGTISSDQAEDLKQELDGMETDSDGLPKIDLGTDGTIAVSFFQDHGFENTDLEAALQQAASQDSTQNAYAVFANWATSNGQEQLVQFLTPQLFQEPEQQEPAPEQPEVDQEQPEAENSDMEMNPGTMEGNESVEEMVRRIVHQHYNRDNPEVGAFRGEEGIVIEVKKEVEDVHGEEAAMAAEEMAQAEMAKCEAEWNENHGSSGGGDLSRIKEIISKMEKSMEGIGDQGHSGRDFNKNIMSSETKSPEMESILKLAGLAK